VVTAIANKEAEMVADIIYRDWFAKFGIPAQIHTDGGKEFINKLSAELFQLLNVRHAKTSPVHPQCNAQVEVFNKTVKKFLQSFVDDTTQNWKLSYQPWLIAITLAITLQLQLHHLNYYLGKKCNWLHFQIRTSNKIIMLKHQQQKDLIHYKNCNKKQLSRA
jgi:hypothetical protein